jgi:hypothetical protein
MVEWLRQRPTPTRNVALTINFSEIIDKANKRRINLENIVGLILNSIEQHSAYAKELHMFFQMLDERWKALDEEGRLLLPDDVRKVLPMMSRYIGHIEEILGETVMGGDFPALSDLCKYGTKPAPRPTPILDELVEACEGPRTPDPVPDYDDMGNTPLVKPPKDTEPKVYWIEDNQQWQCSCPGLGAIGVGNSPNEAFVSWKQHI